MHDNWNYDISIFFSLTTMGTKRSLIIKLVIQSEILDNPKNKFSGIWGGGGHDDKSGHLIWILQVIKSGLVSHQSGKFPLSRKFRVDNFECNACNYRNKEKVKEIWNKVFFLFFIQGRLLYWNLQNPNLMSFFVGRDWKTSIIRKNRIIEIIRYCGRVLFVTGCDGTPFTSSNAACNRRYHASQNFALVRKN